MLCLDGKRRRPKREFLELREMNPGDFVSVADRVWRVENHFDKDWTTIHRLNINRDFEIWSTVKRHRLIGWHGLLGAKS